MNKSIPFVLGLLLLILTLWIQTTPIATVKHFISRIENSAYDLQLRAYLLTQPKKWKTSVAIVDIDDKSLAQEGRWPWPRFKLAELIERLQEAGAVVAAFDILFPEKEENAAEYVYQELKNQKLDTPSINRSIQKILPNFDHDARLAESLKRMDVVLGISFLPTPQTEGLLPTPVFQLTTPKEKKLDLINAPGYLANIPVLQNAAKGGGFINVFPDEDGIVRRSPILIRYGNNLYPALALEAVRLYLMANIQLISARYGDHLQLEAVEIGNHIIPTNYNSDVIITFRGRSFSFPYYSVTDVLHHNIPADALQGKIVFIGTSATGQGDLKTTAIQSVFPGIEIQATIADGILTDNFSFKPAWSEGAEVFITLCLGIFFIFTFPYLGPRSLIFLIIIVPVLLISLNTLLWENTGLLISVFIPTVFYVLLTLINLFYGYLFETRKREKLKRMFGQYVPGKHIDEMLTSHAKFDLYGEDQELTVLFADIRNFTTLSEPLPAHQVKELLNEFFTPMTKIIFKFHGTIDKYVGDMIMAFWGAPLKDAHHARHAIMAALEMQKRVGQLKKAFALKKWPEINIGIGINTGIMSVGDMGSKFRRSYTVLGDAVNLASRVEQLAKYYGVKIIVTEFTREKQKLFIFRKLDRVRVKGKVNSIEIYEPLGYVKTISEDVQKEVDLYHLALDYYFSQQWEKASALFTELSNKKPHEKLYRLYLRRIHDFETNPPLPGWDGVYQHLEK